MFAVVANSLALYLILVVAANVSSIFYTCRTGKFVFDTCRNGKFVLDVFDNCRIGKFVLDLFDHCRSGDLAVDLFMILVVVANSFWIC